MNRIYIPQPRANVKLKTFADYISRGIETVWANFRTVSTNLETGTAILQRTNAGTDEGEPLSVPFTSIDSPIGWEPSYTIYCTPDKVTMVLGWFARGIRVKVDHALDRMAGNCFMPLDNPNQAPTWGYETADDVPPAECPKVFSIVARVESEFRMPKDPWVRKQVKLAHARHGWKIWNRNFGANGFVWYRSKETIAYDATIQSPLTIAEIISAWNSTNQANIAKVFTPPETALDLLSRLDAEYFRTNEGYNVAFEQSAIRNGRPIPRWILNRAEYHLNDSLTSSGNSTWMFDPEAPGDPVNRRK